MNEKHLLFWILDYLCEKHPGVLYDMRDNLKGDKDNEWVSAAMKERFDAYKAAIDAL